MLRCLKINDESAIRVLQTNYNSIDEFFWMVSDIILLPSMLEDGSLIINSSHTFHY